RDRSQQATVLDFGCGLAGLKARIDQRQLGNLDYSGLEVSSKFAQEARQRYPAVEIYVCDFLANNVGLPKFDYVIMNGIFTRRQNLSIGEMTQYLESLTAKVFELCNLGIAFNVMSKCADWESELLYYPNFDQLSSFVSRVLTP